MLDTDIILMRRALELAGRGAGLASPNPLVGALLVNEGRIAGEGYHIYKQIKHAETYALEAAGALAEGSTLYCNLEPCCHQGRTPPCTDALIDAKIARAIVAVKDPNPSVNGRGIERLREAGIEVEVGLLEEDAIRTNESYFRFTTTRMPFVHGVIEFPDELSDEAPGERWRASSTFVNEASKCDALILGGDKRLNRLLIREGLKRDRYRPLVVLAAAEELKQAERSIKHRDRERVSFVEVATQEKADTYSRKVATFPSPSSVPPIVSMDFEAALLALARAQITSVINLPGVFDSSNPQNFTLIDKLTMVIPDSMDSDSDKTTMSIGGLEFEMQEINVVESGGFTELTGYPLLRGAA